MKYVFFVVMPAAILGANFFVFYRLWNMVPSHASLVRWAIAAFAAVAVPALFISIFAGEHLPQALTGTLYKLGTSWLFIMIYFLLVILAVDILKATHLIPPGKLTRDTWLGFAAVTGTVAVIMALGYARYLDKERVELGIRTGKTEGLRIVAVSDMHLGYGTGKRELAGWVELINAENPDVVLIAGDVTDNSLRPVIDGGFAGELKRIRSKYGVFAVPGNHEYIGGIDRNIDFLRSAGITILRDSVALIDSSFYIIGRDDRVNRRRSTLDRLTEGLDPSLLAISLDHQPYGLDSVRGVDLQISGHTHRGQVWPFSWITDAMYEKSHGYMHRGGTHFYVSSGIGIWGGKFRIGTRSEYVVINLDREAEP